MVFDRFFRVEKKSLDNSGQWKRWERALERDFVRGSAIFSERNCILQFAQLSFLRRIRLQGSVATLPVSTIAYLLVLNSIDLLGASSTMTCQRTECSFWLLKIHVWFYSTTRKSVAATTFSIFSSLSKGFFKRFIKWSCKFHIIPVIKVIYKVR